MPTILKSIDFKLDDHIGSLIDRITERWLLTVRETNPAILAIFRDKNACPSRFLLPWSGEFAGKHLTSCAYIYRLTRSKALYDECRSLITELPSYQEEDGYLGPYPEPYRLTGTAPAVSRCDDRRETAEPDAPRDTWDAWGHYHTMWGLLLWYDLTGDAAMLTAVERIAALFMRKFSGSKRLVDIGSTEMNLAPYHAFAHLAARTGRAEYLAFARRLETECADPRAGDYLAWARSGKPFWQCPKPRWESLHVVMGIAEMADATGDRTYLDAAMQIFLSILGTDVHNTGGFSTNEQAVGHPYTINAPIETCCVVAYNTLATELYKKTGDKRLVEFLEWSHYNAVAGAFSKSGRWSTYNTPMDGHRRANYHDIVFQSRPGSPDLNCCSVNAPRGLGLVADWGWVVDDDGALRVNYYGNARFTTAEGDEVRVGGSYLLDGKVTVDATLSPGRRLRLRIPAWSTRTTALVDGDVVTVEGDTLEVMHSGRTALFFTPRFVFESGQRDCEGLTSVRRGPVLFGLDADENREQDFDRLPLIDRDTLAAAPVEAGEDGSLHVSVPAGNRILTLTDFYSLGQTGAMYKTWLKIVCSEDWLE